MALAKSTGGQGGTGGYLYIYLLCSGKTWYYIDSVELVGMWNQCDVSQSSSHTHTHAHTGNGADFGLDPITACQAVRMMGDYEEGTRWEQEGIRRGFTAIAPLFSQITNLYRGNGCLRLSEKSIDSN